ncbi:S8 family peptidase [Lentzea sp. NPDC051213]|uniref:S8 family peptidase n=1 Tax=Lentzea sp. NPDC051213 TaxID=3364126 RepID=UPI00379987B8
MPNQFVWVRENRPVPEDRQGEPSPWPVELLNRHGLRELKPAEAVPDPRPDIGPLRSTVYRAATLLIPDRLFRQGAEATLQKINEVLGDAFGDLVPPKRLTTIDLLVEPIHPYLDVLADLPRPAVLVAADDQPAPDAWVALQRIRRAVLNGAFDQLPEAAAVAEISLEHAFFGAMYGPGPNGEPHTGGPKGVRDDVAVALRSGYGRRPVAFLGSPPERPEPRGGKRRPVVAVLDTGHGSCSWFGTTPQDKALPADGFLRTFGVTQQLILAQEQQVKNLIRTQVLMQDWEEPLYADGIGQVLASATGHGSFIAGLIRQHAPGADVVSIRVLQPDNLGYESDILLALYMLLAKLRTSRGNLGGDNTGLVDVISLSLGYYAENTDEKDARITKVLRALSDEGVVTVAAAGNDASARPFLPAALAFPSREDWIGPELVGCGALNPNGSVAWFSNTGPNASVLAIGANVVSTFPDDVRGSFNPAGSGPDGREGMDPDDYSSGFATWSGTSFSAPIVAAEIANGLIDTAEAKPRLSLDQLGQDVSVKRARKAVRRLRRSAARAKKARRW